MKGYIGEACSECNKFHSGAEWDMPKVRHVREHNRMQLSTLMLGGGHVARLPN